MTKAEQLKRIVELAEELDSLQQEVLGEDSQCEQRAHVLWGIMEDAEEMLDEMAE
jgi:hypothetical protein